MIEINHYQFLFDLYDLFTRIIQCNFTGTVAIVWLFSEGYG